MFSSTPKQTEKEPLFPLKTEGTGSGILPQEGATVIARGVKLEGDFTSKGDVVIEGEVRGKVTASGKLTVGSEATIHADVAADDAVISGLVQGNVTVKAQVVLHATARVTGDLVAERATVESGAVLEGKVQIGPKKLPATPPAPTTEAKTKADDETPEEPKTA